MAGRFRTWWQARSGEEETPFDGDTPAWLVSLVFHLGLLIILTIILRELPQEDQGHVELVTSVIEEDVTTPEEFFFSHLDKVEVGANSVDGADMAEALDQVEEDFTELDTPPEEELEVEVEIGEVSLDSVLDVTAATESSQNFIVQGSAGTGTTGAAGAIDRITQEILDSLEQRDTLVVWIFDKSVSLSKQREAIHGRLDRIYEELGVIEATGHRSFANHDLLSSVIGFGGDVSLMTPEPTDSVAEVKAAIAALENDDTGKEMVFSAVYMAAEKYKDYANARDRRSVMMVVFTDEAGDDEQRMLEKSVGACRRYAMPIYVVGIPSPFGRKTVEVKWIDPDPQYDQTPQWTPVTQGPESMFPERVKLSFSGIYGVREEPLDSGFGPYGLTRLCVETGGIYFSVHPSRKIGRPVTKAETGHLSAYIKYFFDPEVMRRYRPDYVTFDEYRSLLNKNAAKKSLVNASMMSWQQPLESPRMRFPKRDEASLNNSLTESQQKAAKLMLSTLPRMYEELKKGERDREKMVRPRWRAGYDLAMGRVMATKVRVEGYNSMLAQLKRGIDFKVEKNDTWILKPSNEVFASSTLEKAGEKARFYLERVVEKHPGTPWAMLAALELKDMMGWTWTETYTGVNRPRENPGNNNAQPRRRDDQRKKIERKPKRQPPKI
ncbi:MAG: vWA domain-containing protein [Pirellulales bacterium]